MKRVRVWAVICGLLMWMCGCQVDNPGQNGNKTVTPVATATPTATITPIEENPMKDITAKDIVAEMVIGWNLGNTMDCTNANALKTLKPELWETAWGNPVTSEELIAKIIDEGFNVIRIPVTWQDHILVAEDYKIEEQWMDRIQELVDYAYARGAYVILNAHHEGWYEPYYENQEAAEILMREVWPQIAERFKDYDEHLIFEGMNEPRKRDTSLEWNGGDQEGWDVVNYLNGVFIDIIRNAGGNNPYRCLMLPGYAANCTVGIKHLEVPEGDDKLIVSVHAYEPYNFALNENGTGLWKEDTRAIDTLMQNLEELFLSKDIPVIIGEFGAIYKPVEGNEASRAEWAEYYVAKAREYGVPCVWWDNGYFEGQGEPFGLIDRKTLEWKYPLVLEGIRKGLE